jgi:iron complex outermembrane receptor protein
MVFRSKALLVLGIATWAISPGLVFAQSAQAGGDQASADDEGTGTEPIVVTGTLIRGIAPAGNNVIGVTTEQIAASGATTTNQILGSLPQVGNFFNQLPAGVSGVAGANASNPISRPNLRNLPGANTSGGAQTLVLLDGHRIVGAGTAQVAVDPDIIAPGVIERVEALTDGGSAVYGSDALGGVLNFITRRKFDGVQANVRYGFGDDYQSVDGNLMVGRDWGTGGLYLSYGYSHHSAIFGSDRDFVKQIDWNTGIPAGRNCANPNVTVNGASYVVAGGGIAAGGPNACDLSDDMGIYPESTLHTAFGRLVQDLSDSIHFDVTALYSRREIDGQGGTLGSGTLGGGTGDVTLTATNPNYRDPGGANAGLPERVLFNYAPLFGSRSNTQETDLTSWSVAPSLAVDLGSGWQARLLFSYGSATTETRNATISATAQSLAVANGTLNPFDVGGTSAEVAASLLQYSRIKARNELYDYRGIVDGPLFTLPGGDVRVALGYEHMQDNFRLRSTNATTFAFGPLRTYAQKVDSAFGEVQIPLVSGQNASSFIHELTISGSARYDKYNDFGDTFNPKLGATYRPVEWIAIRGNWGKSFTAPSPVDQLNVFASTVSPVPAAFLQPPPGVTAGPTEVGVFVGGTAVGIQPQKATNWSIGAEIKPPFIEGLTLSASYYKIDLKGTIGRPVTGADLSSFYAGFPDLFLTRPSGQELAAYLTQFDPQNVAFTVLNPTSTAQAQISSGGQTSPVVVLLDTRGRNLGSTKLSGLDFSMNYIRTTSFGSIDASFAGNYRIRQRSRSSAAAPEVNDLAFEPRLNFQGTLGATVGPVRGQVIWNHTAGFDLSPTSPPAAFGQTRLKAFDAINLYFRYEMPRSLFGEDMDLTLNVQNLFDVDPPIYRAASLSTPGYDTAGGHAFTIGRIVQIGVSKKF